MSICLMARRCRPPLRHLEPELGPVLAHLAADLRLRRAAIEDAPDALLELGGDLGLVRSPALDAAELLVRDRERVLDLPHGHDGGRLRRRGRRLALK
jgi:hypothetical protein